MIQKYPAEWRTQSPWKKRFYARYMKWLERLGYAVVAVVLGAFIFAFNYRVDDVISADNVPIKAHSKPVRYSTRVLIVNRIAGQFEEVQKGDPLVEVVLDEHVDRFLAREALARMGELVQIAEAPTLVLRADSAGVFVMDEALIGTVREKGEVISELRNYDDLRLEAKLSGQGVAAAKTGGFATLRSPVVSSPSGTLVRGTAGTETIVSGQLFSEESSGIVGSLLRDLPLSVRDDIPLKIEDLVQIQIDAEFAVQAGRSGDSLQVDPPAASRFRAEVIAGKHLSVIQFARLPEEKKRQVEEVIESALVNRGLTGWDGSEQTIQSVRGLNTVFQVNGVPGEGDGGKTGIDGTVISRSFNAEMTIESPSEQLKRVVREADALGQTVTVRVELKTGDRPIAMLLLRRS